MKGDLSRGWVLSFSDTRIGPLAPRYRGAFEAGEVPPKRVSLGSSFEENGASVRFRAPSFPRRRSFGVSMEIPPETWQPAGSCRGWQFFRHGEILLGLWTSLPATWLAQTPDGSPLPPPWRELWTFGHDHLWSCRICSEAGNGKGFSPGGFSACREESPSLPSRFTGKVHRALNLL